ncbi:S24 family peptidase [Intestinimonas sp.]|uniref:helix-turn-helix domain-containing protein n=1 Tax=Intestinimonas sp. TaxID=1965293 RepID=UPI0026089C82|nr:S24 family peptidase [Intestinimonas sp.]
MSISTKLTAAKHRLGFTSAELACRSGVPLSTVNKILSGQTRHPSPQALDQLCRTLGISLSYLLKDDIPGGQYIPVQCEETGLRYLSSQEWELVRDYGVLTVQGRAMVDSLLELLLNLSPLPLPTGKRRLLLCFQPAAQGLRGAYMDGFRYVPLDVTLDSVTEQADFCLLLTDRSMEPVYLPGTMLAVKRQPAGPNQLGLFLLGHELFFRTLSRSTGRTKLVAINLEYKDVPVRRSDELHCLGTILGAVRDYVRLPARE